MGLQWENITSQVLGNEIYREAKDNQTFNPQLHKDFKVLIYYNKISSLLHHTPKIFQSKIKIVSLITRHLSLINRDEAMTISSLVKKKVIILYNDDLRPTNNFDLPMFSSLLFCISSFIILPFVQPLLLPPPPPPHLSRTTRCYNGSISRPSYP